MGETSSPPRTGKSRSWQLAENLGRLPLEEVPCYLCGETEGRILVDDPPFKVRLCSGCGLGYTSPRLSGERIHEIYGEEYWRSESAGDYGYSCYEEDLAGYLRTFQLKADVVQKHVGGGSLLEIGCAAGYFLTVMRERGFGVHGIEISEEIAATARERFGLPDIRSKLLAESGYQPGSFDVAAMWDVVEHMADPITELRRVRGLLKEGGLLVLQTQDVSSLTRRILGSRWHHFKQLEHIYHFDPRTIRTLLARAGFRVLEITRRRAGKYVSFDFIAERSRRFGRIPGLLGRPLRLLGRRFLYVNPFDEMIVLARPAAEPPGLD